MANLVAGFGIFAVCWRDIGEHSGAPVNCLRICSPFLDVANEILAIFSYVIGLQTIKYMREQLLIK